MEREIIAVTERLLNAVGAGDFATYAQLSDAALTCIEPETCGTIVEGLAFHKHFFPKTALPGLLPKQNHVSAARVHVLGPDAAVIAYVRVIQGPGDKVVTAEETRAWRRDRVGGQWKDIHFHRSSRL